MIGRRAFGWVCIGLAGIGLVACGGGHKNAIATRGHSVAILEPSDGARVEHSTLTVRVRANAPGLRAVLDGRDVSQRFGAPSGGVSTATLALGRDFQVGSNALRVEVGRAFQASHDVAGITFTAFRRVNGRLRVRNLSSDSALVALRARSTHAVTTQRVIVNGRASTQPATTSDDKKGFDAELSARNGLHFGRNQVTIEAAQADGTLSRKTQTVVVPSTKPLADAGQDSTAAAGRAVRLDASATKPPPGSGPVSYSWRIASAPSGSKARTPAAGAKPFFKPDLPGSYVLQMVASSPSGTRAVDETDVNVAPTNDPMGIPIQTIRKDPNRPDDFAIVVGSQSYKRAGDWVQVLVLDPVTLQPTDGGAQGINADTNPNSHSGADALSGAIINAGQDDLIIISGQGNNSGGRTARDNTALRNALSAVGATINARGSTYADINSFNVGDWSAIGRKGTPNGAAWQNYKTQEPGIPGFVGGDGGRLGSLNGYLQKVNTLAYDFVSPEYTKVDTKAPGSSNTTNYIQVGGQRIASGALSGGGKAQGVQVLVLDSSDLSLKGDLSATWQVRNSDGTLNQGQLSGLAKQLDGLATDPTSFSNAVRFHPWMVVVQTFGNVSNNGLYALGNDRRWVDDTLPAWGPNPHGDHADVFYNQGYWCGGTADTKTFHPAGQPGGTCNQYPRTPAGLGDNPTVTHAIGLMAGMPARTAVANLGRNGATEALAMIASAHPYNDDQQSVHVGTDGNRLVATLRRTKQSQWRASAAAPSSSFDAGSFWDTAFGANAPWPDEASADQPLGKASQYIVSQLWPDDATCQNAGDPCVTDVRQEYVPHISQDWDANYNQLNQLAPPQASNDVVSAYNQLKPHVLTEFTQLAQVQNMFKNYETIFTNAGSNTLLDMQYIATKIESQALKDAANYAANQVELNVKAPVGGALYFASHVFGLFPGGEFLGGPIALFASAWDFFSEIANSGENSSQPVAHPPDYPQRILDRASQVGHDLFVNYETLNSTLDHLLQVFAGNAGRLTAAAAHAKGKWELTAGSGKQKLLIQSLATGIETSLYEALMPVAYDEWFIAPVFQSSGGDKYPADVSKAGPQTYVCHAGPNPFHGSSVAPDSTVHYIRYQESRRQSDNAAPVPPASAGYDPYQRSNHSIGVGLKSKSSHLALTESDVSDEGYGGTREAVVAVPSDNSGDPTGAGASPPAALTDPLFQKPLRAHTPYDPQGLGINKDEFFGLETWTAGAMECSPSYDYRWGRSGSAYEASASAAGAVKAPAGGVRPNTTSTAAKPIH